MRFGHVLAIAAGVVIVMLLATEGIARAAHASFIKSVVLGQDKRTSTSKTFILVWTLLVAWALVSLLIAGAILGQHPCIAAMNCSMKNDKLGLLQIGWQKFVAGGLAGSYLVLLGIPATAGVAAKVVTQTQVTNGTITKTAAVKPSDSTIVARLAQIFSGDDGTTDIGDFQYVVFNLITAAYFVATFIHKPSDGLPVIPDTLLGLTSVSAALYVGKKAAGRSTPTITGVFPSTLRAGETFTVTGISLTADDPSAPAGTVAPSISVNDVVAASVIPNPTIPDRLTAVVPAGLVPANKTPPIGGKVVVFTAYGAITPGFDVDCA